MLKWKHKSEELLKASGLPFTIVRPGRLTDGPYTSYDLNTLLQVGPLSFTGKCHLADSPLPCHICQVGECLRPVLRLSCNA